MPVLPDVESSRVFPGRRAPVRSPSRIIAAAARSFTDPPGFRDSSLAWTSTPGGGSSAPTRTSGVLPISDQTAGRFVSAADSLLRMAAGLLRSPNQNEKAREAKPPGLGFIPPGENQIAVALTPNGTRTARGPGARL